MKPFGLYVHIPFCSHRCPYCDFNVEIPKQRPEREYIDALQKELQLVAADPLWKGRDIQSIYIGGGTPSLISIKSYHLLFSEIQKSFEYINSNIEISFEFNPEHAEREYFRNLLDLGVNRLSFGIQSFTDKTLTTLGRRHTSHQAREAVCLAREAGVSNINIDGIYGVPHQTLEDLKMDVRTLHELMPNHISYYALTIEKGTSFYRSVERGRLTTLEEDLSLEMMDCIHTSLVQFGYEHYEVSNFAHSKFESKHNMGYWSGADYLGIGAGAHSYHRSDRLGELFEREKEEYPAAYRWSNIRSVSSYMEQLRNDKIPISWKEEISMKEHDYEIFYTGLRLIKGIQKNDYTNRKSYFAWEEVVNTLANLPLREFLQITQESISFTDTGHKIADTLYLKLREVFRV